MEYLIELDKALFLFLNGLHTPWLDFIMLWATKTVVWIPMYLFFVYLIIKDNQWNSLYVFLGIILTVAMADQLTSGLMKPFFARLRPSHNPSFEGLVHIVNNYKGGMYGFASGHAANSFGIALFLYGLFRKKYAWMVMMFPWAAGFSYTRIYLGVHYPGDILVGSLVGLMCGSVGLVFIHRFYPRGFVR